MKSHRTETEIFEELEARPAAINASIIQAEAIRLVHCRSFPPALIGYRLNRRFGTKYVFDFRDFYADGGLDKARGLSRLGGGGVYKALMTRFVFITGGVVSSLGKGIASAALGALPKSMRGGKPLIRTLSGIREDLATQ